MSAISPLLRNFGSFAAALFCLVVALEGQASAQLTWGTYKGRDNKTYTYPQWQADNINAPTTATVSCAKADYLLTTGLTLDAAIMKVYPQGYRTTRAGIPCSTWSR